MKTTERTARNRLLDRRRQLVGAFERNEIADKELRTTVEPDWPDRAQELTADGVLAKLTEREQKEVAAIDGALQRIEAGTYGRCTSCNAPIGRQRLTALPAAALCLECEERAEHAA